MRAGDLEMHDAYRTMEFTDKGNLENGTPPRMALFRPPSFLHYPASRHNHLIASVCVTCHRYVAAGDLQLLKNVERQHICDKKGAENYTPQALERRRAG